MDNSKSRPGDPLGVNKIGKNIKKSPVHQPNFAANIANKQQPQPQVYNISKNDFRHIVQQLTGSPSREQLPRPPQNPQKSQRLQKIRPPPLAPINRPLVPVPVVPTMAPQVVSFNNNFVRPAQFGQPSPPTMPPWQPGESGWANTAESPISAYMRYLQSSIVDPSIQREIQAQPPLPYSHPPLPPPQPHGQVQSLPMSAGLLPYPTMPALPSPRLGGPLPPPPTLPGLLPSPTSQFLLPSPTGFMNLLSPKSPYPLLSPGTFQFSPPLTPNFGFSSMAQPGILGPGPPPPPSPGLVFPLSPSTFLPIHSPRWRDQ